MSYLLGYYGGKIGGLGQWIVSHLPEHTIYVEPFGGMAGVLLRKRPAPVEVYNDLASELTNLFRIVRDQPEALRELLALTPYSRDEYKSCRELRHEPGITQLERARRTYVILSQSRDGSLIGKGFSFGGAAYRGSVADTFVRGQVRIPEICGRLRTVLLENSDWQNVCQQHDGPATCFYLDPPYVRHTRTANDGYVYELTDQQHQQVIAWCLAARGMILLSGYEHDLYAPLLAAGWHCERRNVVAHSSAARKKAGGTSQASRQECLWINPAARAAHARPTLFANCS